MNPTSPTDESTDVVSPTPIRLSRIHHGLRSEPVVAHSPAYDLRKIERCVVTSLRVV